MLKAGELVGGGVVVAAERFAVQIVVYEVTDLLSPLSPT